VRTLKKLSEIAWTEKAVASGKASHVPQALTGLISHDEKIRNRSYWQLDNEVVLQSDLFEAAYFVIPFLIQYLDERVSYGRDRIYDLLLEIANGYAPANVRCLTSERDEVSLMAACTRELKKGLPTFDRDAADTDHVLGDKAKELIDLLARRMQENGGDSENMNHSA
jgi:hypothetical protein